MKRKITVILSIIATVLCAALFCACGGSSPTPTPTPTPTPAPDDNLKNITGVTYVDASYDYDGTEKSLNVTGELPSGVTVAYTSNKGTNAGVYNAEAVLSGDGYKTLTLKAKLTINKLSYDMSGAAWNYSAPYTYDGDEKTVALGGLPQGVTVKAYKGNAYTDAGEYSATAEFNYDTVNYNAPMVAACAWTIQKANISDGITMAGATVEYDALQHSLQVVGNVPNGVSVEYYYNDVKTDGVSAVGTYNVKCVLSGKNYNSKEITATLKINSTEEQLYSAAAGGKIYFQNNLDGNKLYTVNGGAVAKINSDIPNYMIGNGNNLYYFGTSMFSKVIKSYNGTTTAALIAASGEYLVTDGTNVYYAVNNTLLNTDKNGIYKYPISGGNDVEPTRIFSGKAKYLTYCNGYIYFSNGADNEYLYRISPSGGNAQKLNDEKATYIVTDGADVYYNSTKEIAGVVGIAAAIYKYDVSAGKAIKLTTDGGKYLTVVGNHVYYINNDKLTSTLFGDGIYRTLANRTADSSAAGEKVMSSDNNGYSSLSSDGTYLYYYKLNDKHFYRYNPSADTETDLMANFTPVDNTVLSGYSAVKEYNGEIYYTNPLDDSCLYKYNPVTRSVFKVLADSVSSVFFNGDYMYYNSYIGLESVGDYTLKRLNMKTNEITVVSKERCENLIFDGDKIYYTRLVAVGTNSIKRMDLDGSNSEVLYDSKSPNVFGFEKVGDDIYFIMNPALGYQYIYKYDGATKKAGELNGIKAKGLAVANGTIYYFDGTSNALKSCNLDGTGAKTLKDKVDINYMHADGGKVYFSSISSTNTGLYVLDTASGNITQICNKPAHGISVYNGNAYFLQSAVSYTNGYPVQASGYDGHLYCYNGATVTKVA